MWNDDLSKNKTIPLSFLSSKKKIIIENIYLGVTFDDLLDIFNLVSILKQKHKIIKIQSQFYKNIKYFK